MARMTLRVLVTSAGTASAISVIRALRAQREIEVSILAVDTDPTAPGLYLADRRELVPPASNPDYVPALQALCQAYDVRALYPIYSREIELLTQHADGFCARGVRLLLPRAETVRRCNDKRAMYRLVSGLGISVPGEAGPGTGVPYPWFGKPNSGSGTSGTCVVRDSEDEAYFTATAPGLLWQEMVEGPEYTVDILCDQSHQAVVASPRLRLATRAGQSVKGRTVDDPELVARCGTICRAVEMVGPCNLQFIRRGRDFIFIEANPRYAAGGLMLTVAAGGNIPFLALQLMLNQGTPSPVSVRSGVTMLRYYEEIILQPEDQL
jgi:carbamoyl-phosphate synthase large subunit